MCEKETEIVRAHVRVHGAEKVPENLKLAVASPDLLPLLLRLVQSVSGSRFALWYLLTRKTAVREEQYQRIFRILPG